MRENTTTMQTDWTEQGQPELRSLLKIKETKLSYSPVSVSKQGPVGYAAGVAFMSRETYPPVNRECQRRVKKHSTNLQVPDVANFIVLFNFWGRGRACSVGNVPTLEFQPTLISEMKEAYEAEARANISELISRI